MLEKKRDLMAKLLTDVGFKPTIPEGGYFMMADTSDIGKASLIDKPFPRRIIWWFVSKLWFKSVKHRKCLCSHSILELIFKVI